MQPTLSPDVVVRELDGEAIVLQLQAGIYFQLNEVAADVVKLVEQGNNLEQIEACLLEEYDVDPSLLRADIEGVIADLVERDILRRQ